MDKITAVEVMNDDVLAAMMWDGQHVHGDAQLVLSVESHGEPMRLFASMDPEGNGPGVIWCVNHRRGDVWVLTVEAAEQFVGQEILRWEEANRKDYEAVGWMKSEFDACLVAVLPNYARLIPGFDPEGNGAGAWMGLAEDMGPFMLGPAD